MAPSSFSFELSRWIRRWTWFAFLGIAGGLVGLLAARAQPPLYEAGAVLAVGVDYPRTPPLEIPVETRVLDRVAALITSDHAIRLLENELPADVTAGAPGGIRNHLRLDQRGAEWYLVGQAERPEIASALANAWAGVSLKVLDEAMDHAYRALALQDAPLVVACSEMSEGAPADFFWTCLATGSIGDSRSTDLRKEIELSLGILPVVSYHLVSEAQPPTSPVIWNRGPMVLGAAVVGLIAGAVLASVWPDRRVPVDSGSHAGGVQRPPGS